MGDRTNRIRCGFTYGVATSPFQDNSWLEDERFTHVYCLGDPFAQSVAAHIGDNHFVFADSVHLNLYLNHALGRFTTQGDVPDLAVATTTVETTVELASTTEGDIP